MARAKFGGVTQIKESLRDQMGFPMLESIVHDARYAVRGPAGGRCARCRSRIIAGRPFTESDVSGAQRVVLISQRLAETWWPDETARSGSALRCRGVSGIPTPGVRWSASSRTCVGRGLRAKVRPCTFPWRSTLAPSTR